MTLSQRGPASIQVAPVNTPLDAVPNVWMDLGTVDDFQVSFGYKEPEFVLPPLPLTATVDVDLSHISWSCPRPACFSARERIEDHLRRRRITSMLQAALHSYRTAVLPAPRPSLASLANLS